MVAESGVTIPVPRRPSISDARTMYQVSVWCSGCSGSATLRWVRPDRWECCKCKTIKVEHTYVPVEDVGNAKGNDGI